LPTGSLSKGVHCALRQEGGPFSVDVGGRGRINVRCMLPDYRTWDVSFQARRGRESTGFQGKLGRPIGKRDQTSFNGGTKC